MKFRKEMLCLYGITDRAWTGRQTLTEQIEEALSGGVTILQLREKDLDTESLIREAVTIKKICRRYGVPLIINDNVEAALKSGADGVHVGLEDTPVSEIRKQAPEDFIIGATAKTVEQARIAQQQGADYLGVGAVFPSPTKTNAVRITGEQLSEIAESVIIPCAAIGGITYENADLLKGCSIDGIAVVSAIFGAECVKIAAANMKLKAREIVKASPLAL